MPFDAWQGLVRGRRPWRSRVVIQTPLERSKRGGSGAFLGLASDGNRYWVKVIGGPQGDRVPITEQIVGRAGRLIDAPVRPVVTVYVPRALAGWEYRPGARLRRGFAHGSLALESCVEERRLSDRMRDENSRRHVGYYGLFDWCWGGDVQGLLDLDDDRAFHSHDHGWFLPPVGQTWDEAQLRDRADADHELAEDGSGLDCVEVERVASALENVTRDGILEVVSATPRSWPVTDAELESVGAFLEARAPRVAERLRARFGGGP